MTINSYTINGIIVVVAVAPDGTTMFIFPTIFIDPTNPTTPLSITVTPGQTVTALRELLGLPPS